MTASTEPARPRDRENLDVWVRRGCALIVAAVAAYSSYEHQQEFPTSAALWPLSVDGLLLLATVGLVKPGHQSRRMRIAVWSAFLGCIAVSLAANIAAAPGWPGRRFWSPAGRRWPCCWPLNCSPTAPALGSTSRPHRPHPRPSRTPR